MQSESFLPLKSPKRFFSFSGSHPSPSSAKSPSSPHPVSWSSPTSPPIYPVPPLPANAKSHPFVSSQSLGSGATVVRTPAEALQGSMARQYEALGLTYKEVPVKRPTVSAKDYRTMSSPVLPSAASEEAVTGRFEAPLVTPTRPTRPGRPDESSEPFNALLLSRTVRPLPPQPLTSGDEVVVILELAYSISTSLHESEPPRVMLPIQVLRRKAKGSKLLGFIEGCLRLQEEANEPLDARPELTDGESAYSDDSLKEDRLSAEIDSLFDQYADLDALISNEEFFNQSLESPPPTHHKPLPDLPRDPPRSNKKRALFRNQQNLFPSPSSALFTKIPDSELPRPLVLRAGRPVPQLRLSTAPRRVPLPPAAPTRKSEPRRTLTKIRILLLRPAEPYHAIAAYLLHGSFPITLRPDNLVTPGAVPSESSVGRLSAIEAEANWLNLPDVSQAAHRLMPQTASVETQLQSGKVNRSERVKVAAGWI